MNRTEQSTTGKMRVHPAAINLLTDATWDFARAILWDGGNPSARPKPLWLKLSSGSEIPMNRVLFVSSMHRS